MADTIRAEDMTDADWAWVHGCTIEELYADQEVEVIWTGRDGFPRSEIMMHPEAIEFITECICLGIKVDAEYVPSDDQSYAETDSY